MDDLLNKQQKNKLLKIARNSITEYLTNKTTSKLTEDDPLLNTEMGAFVTLRADEELRGCIGNITGSLPLSQTIRDMAIAAATEDPRFYPVKINELKEIKIEISVLSPLRKITDINEIVMGKHGVLVKSGFQSGVYLPQIAVETGWNKEEFMNSLCGSKAGINVDAWKKGKCEIYIFTAEVFSE